MCSDTVFVARIRSSCIKFVLSIDINNGFKATLSSLCTDLIFENHLHPVSFALMSSYCGVGWLVDIMALLTLQALSVILIEPSVFGAITAFETYGAGWFIGCSSMIS